MSPVIEHPDVSLQIVADKDALAQAAAQLVVDAAASAVAARGRFVIALSGGSTPQDLFALLAAPTYASHIDWPAVEIFWGDERLVSADDPGSNFYHARRLLLDKVPVPTAQIHRVRGELPLIEAVADYERQLRSAADDDRAWPLLDLALMGLGADGHTASLFPGSSAARETARPVLGVTADYQGRPASRVTLTPPVFNDAKVVMFLVAGADKAEALAAVLEGEQDIDQWPAQAIQPRNGRTLWLADEAAAQELSYP